MVFERDSIPAISHILVFEWRTGFLSTVHKEYNQKASFFIEVYLKYGYISMTLLMEMLSCGAARNERTFSKLDRYMI